MWAHGVKDARFWLSEIMNDSFLFSEHFHDIWSKNLWINLILGTSLAINVSFMFRSVYKKNQLNEFFLHSFLFFTIRVVRRRMLNAFEETVFFSFLTTQ